MKNVRNTRHALVTSLMALLLCFTMLLGTTYAWFTDSVTSAGNKIQAGTLKIDLELYDADTDAFASIKESKAPIFDYELWEPGYTDVKLLKVENEGNLALKWKATLVGVDVQSTLANVIDVYVLPLDTSLALDDDAAIAELPADRTLADYAPAGTLAEFIAGIETTTVGTLEAGKSAYLGIALKMQEDAGNEYQNLSLGTFDVQILATQLNSEPDSFDANYDVEAKYPVTSLEGNVTATENINADGVTLRTADGTTLDLAGNTLSAGSLTADGSSTISGGTITLPADGRVYASNPNSSIALEDVVIESDNLSVLAKAGGTVSLKNVTFDNTSTSNPLQNYGGTLTLENVTVSQEGDAASSWYSSALQVVNTIVLNEETGKYKITSQANTTINGGTYTGKKAIQINAPGGNVTINGGTFVGSEYVLQADFVRRNYEDSANYDSIITITGGTFTGALKISADAELIITGGTFSVDPSAYVPAGYVATESNGTWTVTAQ